MPWKLIVSSSRFFLSFHSITHPSINHHILVSFCCKNRFSFLQAFQTRSYYVIKFDVAKERIVNLIIISDDLFCVNKPLCCIQSLQIKVNKPDECIDCKYLYPGFISWNDLN